jgi:hypothetical protein
MDLEEFFVQEGLLPPLPRWAVHPCEATAGVSGGQEALEVSVRNIKKQIKKAKRGQYTAMGLETMEECLRNFKQQQREVKRDDRKKRKEFLIKQAHFCEELVEQGYPAEWVPNADTPPRWNPVMGLMYDTGVIH